MKKLYMSLSNIKPASDKYLYMMLYHLIFIIFSFFLKKFKLTQMITTKHKHLSEDYFIKTIDSQ